MFRRLLSPQEAAQLYSAFEADRQMGLWMEIAIPEAAFETSVQLAKRLGPRLGARTLDTLHVASALELGAKEFCAFDQRQQKLGKAVELAIP